MPRDPWTFLGWLMVAYLILALITVPIVGLAMRRARRRSIERWERSRFPEVNEKVRARRDHFGG